MANRDCKIVEDLLPIYVDGMCSEESCTFVEEHLAHCSECREKKAQLETKSVDDKHVIEDRTKSEFIKGVAKRFDKNYKLAMIKGLAISLIACMVCGIGYFTMCKLRISKVPNNKIVMDGYRTEDNNLVFQVSADDGYVGGMLDIHWDKESKSCYLTIKRTIVKNKAQKGAKDTYFYSVDEKSIEKIYLGTPKDSKLVWESGDPIESISTEELNLLYQQINNAFYEATDEYYE